MARPDSWQHLTGFEGLSSFGEVDEVEVGCVFVSELLRFFGGTGAMGLGNFRNLRLQSVSVFFEEHGKAAFLLRVQSHGKKSAQDIEKRATVAHQGRRLPGG